MSATQPIRNPNKAKVMYEFCRNRGQLRDSLLIIFCLNTALRISDILKLSCSKANTVTAQLAEFRRIA